MQQGKKQVRGNKDEEDPGPLANTKIFSREPAASKKRKADTRGDRQNQNRDAQQHRQPGMRFPPIDRLLVSLGALSGPG